MELRYILYFRTTMIKTLLDDLHTEVDSKTGSSKMDCMLKLVCQLQYVIALNKIGMWKDDQIHDQNFHPIVFIK